MTTSFHFPVTAAQVGTYFVGQYYKVLQQQPDFVHQFYSDASTILRIDGNTRETATSMLQIHALIMSLNYSDIEIKTANSLESWNGGVLVMVSGSVHLKDFNRRRKFVQTFLLAPQEKGFFVLNDIFHFVEEEEILQHPAVYSAHSNLNAKLNVPNVVRVSNYMLDGDIQASEYASAAKIEENGPLDHYGFAEERLQKVPEAETILDSDFGVHSNGLLQKRVNALQGHLSATFQESVGEPQKHTYASIVAKGYSAPSAPTFSDMGPTPPSEWQQIPEPPSLPSVVSSSSAGRSGFEFLEEHSAMEDDVEVKSVYVKNVPTTMAASMIAEEFKKFGKLRPDGVAIRTRKDLDVCFAFVEFEEITGVQNAIKASAVEIAGHQLYIEGRRPNRNSSYRGRGRGRGRVSYQMEVTRGRFGGGNYGRGSNQDGDARDYSRLRGNGFYRQPLHQERLYSANQLG